MKTSAYIFYLASENEGYSLVFWSDAQLIFSSIFLIPIE